MKTILLIVVGAITGASVLWVWQGIGMSGVDMTRKMTVAQTIKDYEMAEREALRTVMEMRELSLSEIDAPGHDEGDSVWKVNMATVKQCADDLRTRVDTLVAQLRQESLSTARLEILESCCQLRSVMDTSYNRMLAVHGGYDTVIIEEQLRGSRYAYNFGPISDWCSKTFAKGTDREVAIANLLRIKWDITGIEAFHLGKMYRQLRSKCHMQFSPLGATAISSADHVLPGQDVSTTIFMYFNDWVKETNRKVEDVLVNGASVPVQKEMVHHVFTAGKPGLREFNGVYNVRAPHGYVEPFYFRFSVMVDEPKVCVRLAGGVTWFDAGKAVPFKVDIPYAHPMTYVVKASGGTLTGNTGSYTLKADTPGEVMLTVQYRAGDKLMPADSFRYQVR